MEFRWCVNLRSVLFYTYFLSLYVTLGNVWRTIQVFPLIRTFWAMRLERALHLFNIAESRWDVNITFYSVHILLCQNLVPILPTMQLCQHLTRRFGFVMQIVANVM